MLLGIDVGGTFTDAVILDGSRIAAQAKVPTTHEDVLQGILHALDKVLPGMPVENLSASPFPALSLPMR